MNAIEKGKKEIDARSLNCFYAIAPNRAKQILEQTAKAYAVEELEKMRRNPLGAIRHDVENRIKELRGEG